MSVPGTKCKPLLDNRAKKELHAFVGQSVLVHPESIRKLYVCIYLYTHETM